MLNFCAKRIYSVTKIKHPIMFSLARCISIFFLIYSADNDVESTAASLTPTTTTVVSINHTLELYCQVSEKGYDKIVWKKGDDLLAVGSVIVTTNSRINVNIAGIFLQVEKAEKSDSGLYSCQSGAEEYQKQVFQVIVQEFRCPLLEAPKHGNITYVHLKEQTPFINGTVAIYACETGYSLLSGKDNRRKCTEKSAGEEPWDGNEELLCVADDVRLLAKRLTELEFQVKQQLQQPNNLESQFQKGRYSNFPTDRLTRVESQINLFQRKQDDLKDWIIKTLQVLNSTTVSEADAESSTIQHQLNEMWMRVTLLHSELQSRMEEMEKSLEDASNDQTKTIDLEKEPKSPKAATRLTDISSLVSLRLGFLENETKNLEDSVYTQNKLLEHVDAMNTIATSWEETRKVAMARMRLVDGDKLIWEYIWIVSDIDGKMKKSVQQSGHFTTQSSAFYTGVPGYRLRMVFYPDFQESNQMGLFAGLVPGEFDDQVAWPFNWDYQMAVISHDPNVAKDHVGIISMPPITCDLSNFQRPIVGAAPSACGFRHFLSHAMLNDFRKAYVTNGHLWIRIRIYTH